MWDDVFENALREHLPFVAPDEELTAGTPLRELGLDSLGVVELLATLESTYEVRFADDALRPESFDTPGVLWSTLSTVRDAQHA
jgi:acyl carrier protein